MSPSYCEKGGGGVNVCNGNPPTQTHRGVGGSMCVMVTPPRTQQNMHISDYLYDPKNTTILESYK